MPFDQPEPPAEDRTETRRFLAYLKRVDWGLVIVASLSFGAALYVLAKEGIDVAGAILAEDFWLFASILPKVMLGLMSSCTFSISLLVDIFLQFYLNQNIILSNR